MRSALLRIALAAAFAAGCATADAPAPAPASTTVSKDPAAARALIASGAVVLDVRTPDEFAQGHLPNAVNIPVQQLPARLDEVARLAGGDQTRAIVVYCGSGKRAAKAKEHLDAAGYQHVVNGGGLDDLR